MITTPELEASLRQLFKDHEHLADDSAPDRLALEMAGRATSDRRRRAVLALAAAVLMVAGVAVTQQVRGSPEQGRPALPVALPSGPLGDALRTFETSWAAAQPPKLVFLGPLYPEFRNVLGTEEKIVLHGGLSAAADVLSQERPADAAIRSSGGTQDVVSVMSAAETLETVKIAVGRSCTVCEPRVITGATLTTIAVPGASGDVTVPAWAFALEGTSTTVVMSAVSPTQIVTPVPMPLSNPSPTPNRAVVAGDGRELTLEFTGESPDCSRTYTASSARSAHAVAVLIEAHGERCSGPDIGYSRHLTVRLDQPLGDAVVLEAQVGNPIPVQR